MKCKICGSDNIVEENGQFVCKSCGCVFFEAPSEDADEMIKEAKEAIEAKEAELEAKKAEEEEAARAAEEALRAEEARIAEEVLKEAEKGAEEPAEEAQEETTEETPKADAPEEEAPEDNVNREAKIFAPGEPLYEAESMADAPEEAEAVIGDEEEAASEAEEETAEEEATDKPAKKKKSAMREVLDFCFPIIIALVVAMLLKTFVFANAQVPTGSMLNTIQKGDRIIASRVEYKFHEVERFDIIIFKFPDSVKAHEEDPSVPIEFYVKRVIGLPGETVTIVNGVVYVTDKDGKSQQLKDDFVTACTPTGNFGPYEVPEGQYFVMGDNRESSIDSRYWETTNYVDKSLIVGKVKFRYYPSIGKVE